MSSSLIQPATRKTKKQISGFIIGLGIIGISFFIPSSQAISHEGIVSIGILLGAVSMWFCNTMASGIVSLGICFLLYLFGIVPSFADAFSGFTNATTWFILAVFCMTALMQASSLGLRITRFFINRAGADSRKLVLAIMVVVAICSSIMTDTGAVGLGLSIIIPLLEIIGAKKGQSNLGKCLTIGSSFAAGLGGFTTPIGHSLNVLSIGIIEQTTGSSINFLQWMLYGVPCCLILLPITWMFLVRAFPPEAIHREDIDTLMKQEFNLGKLSTHDKKCLVLVIALPTLWIVGNWIPVFSSTTVALLGMILLFAPGINILPWRSFESLASWNLFLFFGGIITIGSAMKQTGAADYLVSLILNSGVLGLPTYATLIILAAALYLINTFFPIAPSVITIALPPLLAYASIAGLPYISMAFLMVGMVSITMLTPLPPALNMSFDTGYYEFREVFHAGKYSSIFLVLVIAVWTFLMAAVIGVG